MSMTQKRSRELIAYWSQHQNEIGLGFDWGDYDYYKICWRCAGRFNSLSPCHIIPKSCGGSDEPNNIVQLCHSCHLDAPNIEDPKFMWIWIRAYAVPIQGTYWITRGLEEYEKIFGYPFSSKIESIDPTLQHDVDVPKKLRELKDNVIRHWGEKHFNVSTIACKLFEFEEMIVNEIKSKQNK